MAIAGSLTRFLIIIFAFLLPFFSYGQTGQKYSIGVKAGGLVNWAGFSDKEDRDQFSTRATFGYAAGVLVSFPLKHEFDFYSEVAYAQKGRKILSHDDKVTNNSTYNFIDVTMLLRKSFTFKLDENIPSQWYFNIGPEVSYWLNGKGTLNEARPYTIVFDQEPDGNFNYMYMNDVNRWLFGLALGVGFRAPLMRNQHINTEIRFVSGHTFLGNKDSSHIEILSFEDTMKTNLKVINIILSYTLDFDVLQQRKGKSTLDKKMKNPKRPRRR